jgi:hypothetical protein
MFMKNWDIFGSNALTIYSRHNNNGLGDTNACLVICFLMCGV